MPALSRSFQVLGFQTYHLNARRCHQGAEAAIKDVPLPAVGNATTELRRSVDPVGPGGADPAWWSPRCATRVEFHLPISDEFGSGTISAESMSLEIWEVENF